MAVSLSYKRQIFVVALIIALSGCSKKVAVGSGLDCFPKDAAHWIYDGKSSENIPKTATTPEKATIYVDRSGSMAGYIVGSTAIDRPFQDMIGTLPGTLQGMNINANYRAFGLKLTEVVDRGATELAKPNFYNCASADRSNCDNNESRLDLPLSRIADTPDEMGIIISDLWFTNSEVQTSGIATLQPILTRILESGRTISIYGFSSPFTGKIYDLPAVDRENWPKHIGTHPFYMLVVGTKAQALAFETELGRSGAAGIARAVAGGLVPRTHFTVDPGPLTARSKMPLEAGSHPRMASAQVARMNGASLQQFKLTPGLPPRPGSKPDVAPRWTAPADDAFIRGAVWRGELTRRLRVWTRKDELCTVSSWTAPIPLEGQWETLPREGKERLTLDPARLAGRLPREGFYLVSGELERKTVFENSKETDWMRVWNLAPGAAFSASVAKSGNFPTLNLSEFARLMEVALDRAAKRKGGGIVGFSVLVKVEK